LIAYGPIDVVYTWVNGSDPLWIKKKEFWRLKYLEESTSINDQSTNKTENEYNSNSFANETLHIIDTNSTNPSAINETTTTIGNNSKNEKKNEHDETMSSNRFRDSDELRYSLRSLVRNAPWIRHIYLVTDNQLPHWLNVDTKRLTVVSHQQIFLNKSHLPVFSSPAIEAHLHRIPNLSSKFIYFNDDVFLGASVFPDDFFSVQGVQKFFMSWDVPKCAPGCSDSWIGDGFCDKACNVSSCNFDFPDCVNGSSSSSGDGQNYAGFFFLTVI
jgi:UDP-N-acetylglucosamine-lysosomal-enzyme